MATNHVWKRMKADMRSIDRNDKDPNLLPKHKIFFSHSRAQNYFVELLCVDLERRNCFPFCSFKQIMLSLPKDGFLIDAALSQCEMVVVVLSEEYFASMWLMTELHAIMNFASVKPNLKICPLFFDHTFTEVRNTQRQKGWFKVWEEMAMVNVSRQIKVDEWKQSLNLILRYNGMVCHRGLGLGAWQKEIVSAICRAIPSNISLLDEVHVQGRSKLCQVVYQHFENILDSTEIPGVRVMGLYGMGGIGKTMICKIICNELDGAFDGKVCHVELGNQSKHELLRKVLTTLTNTSMEVAQEMRKEECQNVLFNDMIWTRTTFLVIDNVWDDHDSLKQAYMFLHAPYVEGSWVIVTSRFKKILTSLNIDENACLEMPELDKDDAKKIFLYYAAKGQEFQDTNDEEAIEECMKSCYFEKGEGQGSHYHPLSLKSLGVFLNYEGNKPHMWVKDVKKLKESSYLREPVIHPLFTILRSNFDRLPQREQELFMDVSMFQDARKSIFKPNMDLVEWLCLIYNEKKEVIEIQLQHLVDSALLEDAGMIMHDLYCEFAKLESKGNFMSEFKQKCLYVDHTFPKQLWDDALSKLKQPECSTRIQSHSQSSPKTQQRFAFKPDKNKEDSVSLQIQTENSEPLSEGMAPNITISVEELQSIPRMIPPTDVGHDPRSCNEGSKESSSQFLSSFWEELHKLTRSLSLRKVPTPSKQTANLTLDQFLDSHYLHNPGVMLIAGRVKASNRPSVQFVFKDGEELAKVVGVGCCGQNAVVIITKSLQVQVVHDEDAWHQIWNEARTGGSSSQLMMAFLKNPRSHSTVDDVTTLGNLSSQRLAEQFGVGLECDSHLQSSVKIRRQEKGRQEFLILMLARYLLLDEILETKCHDNYVEASEKNIPFCGESNALRKSANVPHGESNAGEWTWTSTLWANLWNYLPSLVQNVGNTQLGTGRGGIGDGGHGGDGSDGSGGDRDDSSGGDGVLPLPPQDVDLEKDGFAVVEVYPGYGGQWGNKDLVDKDLQDSTITPTLTFHFENKKQRRELNVLLCVRFDLGEVVGPKPRDEEELRFGWFHDNLRISLQSSDDNAAFLKPADHQVVDAPDVSTTTSSTSSSITSNPFHVSLEAPGCSRSSPSSLFAMMGTLGISKDLKSRNTRVMELTSQLIHKQVLGGFHYQDRSTENKNSKLAFRYVFPSIPKDRVVHDDTTRNIYMLSGLCSTVSPTVRGTWHRLNMSEASPYTFHSSRRFNEILASKKRILLKDCKSFQQTYDLKLHINHAMTHIYEYVGRPQRLKGGESCELLEVGSVQEGP